MDAPLACFRCEQPGHGWRECDRPPAQSQQELDARIDRLLQRWNAGYGGFSRATKTRIVEIERTAHRNLKARGK